MPSNDVIVEVIEALAETDGMEPTELDYSLSDYIDPEVLTRLDSMENSTWELTFRVSDHQVQITHGSQIFIDGVIHASDAPWQD